MSKAALAAGLSALWLAESKHNPDKADAKRQRAFSRSLRGRIDDFEEAFDAFASDGFEREWDDFADELRVA